MEITNQNIKAGTMAESRVVIDKAEIFNPALMEIERLRNELATEHEAQLRLAAEYENYRRGTKRESAQAAEAGKRELLERLISLADDLDLALANADESTDVVAEGLRLIHRRFNALLEANGVMAFESKGKKFDPERHEAFDIAHGTNLEPGTVHTEIRCGYFWNNKLLRPALVVVVAP